MKQKTISRRIHVGDIVEKNGRRLIVTGVSVQYQNKSWLKVINEPIGHELISLGSVVKVKDRDE